MLDKMLVICTAPHVGLHGLDFLALRINERARTVPKTFLAIWAFIILTVWALLMAGFGRLIERLATPGGGNTSLVCLDTIVLIGVTVCILGTFIMRATVCM